MRKITRLATQAFNNNTNFSLGNTTVKTDGTTTDMFLHGNHIATKTNGVLRITNAGWSSNVTKERLNALFDVRIYQRKGQWYLNDQIWNGEWTTIE